MEKSPNSIDYVNYISLKVTSSICVLVTNPHGICPVGSVYFKVAAAILFDSV